MCGVAYVLSYGLFSTCILPFNPPHKNAQATTSMRTQKHNADTQSIALRGKSFIIS